MKFVITILFAVCIASIAVAGDAQHEEKSVESILFSNSSRAEFRLTLDQYMAREAEKPFVLEDDNMPADGQKSVGKAVLFSAVVPGSGQAYGGSFLKAAAFFVVEVATISGYVHFQNRGNDLENRFEADANSLWNEDEYWDWISVISSIDRQNMSALREYEHQTFSHFLPEDKSQQYYENIGKYDQFVVGWQDFRNQFLGNDVSNLTIEDYQSGAYNGEDLTTISEQRNAYVDLRRQSNDNFKRATNMATLTLLNHVLSAIDAGLTVKRGNQRVLETRIRLEGRNYFDREIVPTVNLGVIW